LETLSGIPGAPTINYGASGAGLDGEGRITQVTASSGTNPVTGVTYSSTSTTNPLGALTWNTNGTLNQLKITDGITGTTDSQTCNYLYDDLQRLSSSNCGAIWTQNFTYDAFGNITKTGNSQFIPGYSLTQNQFTSIPGVNVSYDGDGNLLTDNLNTYTWDVYGRMSTVNTGSATVTAIYDALGRMVENNAGGSYTEFIYGPTGVKLAHVNGSTLIKAFVALPGGTKAIYNSSGLAYFRHSDWLGSSRLTSTATKPTSMYSRVRPMRRSASSKKAKPRARRTLRSPGKIRILRAASMTFHSAGTAPASLAMVPQERQPVLRRIWSSRDSPKPSRNGCFR
jgi:hypothetical protein